MERRDVQRRHLMFHLRVFDADTGAQLGNIADISHTGLMITGERRLTIGRTYMLQMRLPAAIADEGDFTFPGTVAWVTDAAHPQFYDIGFRDLELAPDQRATLESLIDEFELRETT